MKNQRKILLNSLRSSFDKSSVPVLYIKSDFSPFYFNPKMKSLFPEFCGDETVRPFITEASCESFASSGFGVTELATLPGCCIGSFISSPVTDDSEVLCYKISGGFFGDMGDFACLDLKNSGISEITSDSVAKSLSDLSGIINNLRKNASLEIIEELNEVGKLAEDISSLSRGICDSYRRISKFSSGERTVFRLSELASELSDVTGNVVLPDGFSEIDNDTLIFASRGGVADAFMNCCRFLLVESDGGLKIKLSLERRDKSVVVLMHTFVPLKSDPKPFRAVLSEDGILNYGLCDVRNFIESQDGNILVVKEKRKLSVMISFPAADAESVACLLRDITAPNSFEDLIFEISEYDNILCRLRKRKKK